MKYLSLLFLALVAATVTANEINVTSVVVVGGTDSTPAACPGLLERTYEGWYGNSTTMQQDDGACSCRKNEGENFKVNCGFYYCMSCYSETNSIEDEICLGRWDRYEFKRATDAREHSFAREYVFMYGNVPFTEVAQTPTGGQVVVREGAWTEVQIRTNSTYCGVVAIDELDEEVQMCTCSEVTCGNNTYSQYTFDCTGNRTWGNCNATLNTFEPQSLTLEDPLVVLDENKFSWDYCF